MISLDVVLRKVEFPLAVVDLTGTLLVCVWKTVGLSFVPGWDEMFGPVGQGKQYPVVKFGQWPRWVDLLYLGLYGVLGSFALYGSLKMSSEPDDETTEVDETTILRAKAIGVFHTVMSAHHVAWSLTSIWGRLSLTDYKLPYAKMTIGISSVVLGALGVKMIQTSKTSNMRKIRERKRLLDAASFVSMLPMFAFLPENWFGYHNKAFDTAAFATVPYGILTLLGWNAISNGHLAP